jgi:AcrR family transcriptional regulator
MEIDIKKKLSKVYTLFTKYGVKSLTMNDIAKEMGMSKKTLYKYVDSKEALIELVLENDKEQTACYINQFSEDMNKEGCSALQIFIRLFNQFVKDFSEFSPIFIRDMKVYYPEILNDDKQCEREDALKILKTNILLGRKQGLYETNFDIDIVTKILLSNLISTFISEFIEPSEFKDSTFYKHFLAFNLRSLLTEEGLKVFDKEIENV